MEGRRLIEEYESALRQAGEKSAKVSKVILSGGTAAMSGISRYAAQSTGKEVIIAFPFRGMIYPGELEATLRDIGPSFAVAAGLALRELI